MEPSDIFLKTHHIASQKEHLKMPKSIPAELDHPFPIHYSVYSYTSVQHLVSVTLESVVPITDRGNRFPWLLASLFVNVMMFGRANVLHWVRALSW